MAEPEGPGESSGRAMLASIRRRRRRARALRWLVLLAVLAAAAFAWLQYRARVPPAEPTETAGPAETPEPGPPAAAPAQPAPAPNPPSPAPARAEPPSPAPLPSLADSDAAIREEAAGLSDAPAWSRALGTGDLLERFVLSVVQVSEGTSPRKPLASIAPSAPYRVRTDEDGRVTTDPASYARYDALAAAIAGLDAKACAALYRRYEPLLDRVLARLGEADTPLRDVLARAAADILATPRVVGEPELVFHVNHYRYADPGLETLSPVQKLVLRTGPANARRIRGKVREIALALGIPARKLPETPVYRVQAGGD